MDRFKKTLKSFWDDENGAAMIEYAIIIGVIAVAVVGVVAWIGSWALAQFENLETELQTTDIQPSE